MNDLEQFLALPDVDSIEADVFVSERLGKFKVKAMTVEDFKDYKKKAGERYTKNGANFDSTKYFISIVAGQTIYPNFASKELQDKCGCRSAEEVVSKKMLIGEITRLALKIQEVSGFEDNLDEEIEEAKN